MDTKPSHSGLLGIGKYLPTDSIMFMIREACRDPREQRPSHPLNPILIIGHLLWAPWTRTDLCSPLYLSETLSTQKP